MAEKTEKATPKKLKDARKKGQVSQSQDFPAAFTYITAISLVLALSGFIFDRLAAFTYQILKNAPQTDVTKTAPFYLDEMIKLILLCSLPIAGLVAIIGVLVTFLVVGPVFSVEVFKPNFKKFNPVENIKQKFKMKTVIELIKSILKIGGAAFLIYLAVKGMVGDVVATAGMPPIGGAMVFRQIITKVILWTGIFFILIAVIDLFYQKQRFSKDMKMEKFDVKQEYKDLEGNPEIKSKRRQLAQEIAYEDSTSQIRRAKALVTNPHDIAIAIGYEPEKYAAPWILAKGTESKARAMIAVAEKYNIPIMRNVPLAHELLEEGEVNKFIPEKTYDIESLKLKEKQ
jgi:type III secretion protein U